MDLQKAKELQAAAWRAYNEAVRTGFDREKASRKFSAAWNRVRKLERKNRQREAERHSKLIEGDLPR